MKFWGISVPLRSFSFFLRNCWYVIRRTVFQNHIHVFPCSQPRQMGWPKFVSSIFLFTLHCPSSFLCSQICLSTFSLPYLIYSFTGLIILRISSWLSFGIKGFVSVCKSYMSLCLKDSWVSEAGKILLAAW